MRLVIDNLFPEQRALDAVLETYINQMEELLLDRNLLHSQPGDEVRTVARARTLTALKRLDGAHNKSLIQFLRDAGLLEGQLLRDARLLEGQPGPLLDLKRANLFGASLHGADLHEVNLEEADLCRADLREARPLIICDNHLFRC